MLHPDKPYHHTHTIYSDLFTDDICLQITVVFCLFYFDFIRLSFVLIAPCGILIKTKITFEIRSLSVVFSVHAFDGNLKRSYDIALFIMFVSQLIDRMFCSIK